MFDPNNSPQAPGQMQTMGAPQRFPMGAMQLPGAREALQDWRHTKPAMGGGHDQRVTALQGWLQQRPNLLGAMRGLVGGGQQQPGQVNPQQALGALGGSPSASPMVGTQMGVIGATPATSGFDLPDY